MENERYPKIHIRSKNELAKHICDPGFSYNEALALINDVLENRDRYWKDSMRHSDPEKGKYVRNASGKPLGKLLDRINKKVFTPYDNMLPNFIFGGVSGKNHIDAVRHLLGRKRRRTLLGLDITKFFEQVNEDRVYCLLLKKCGCSDKAARIIAQLCCLPEGPKGLDSPRKTLARGFATSSRLAIWCNLDIFIKLDYLIKKELKGKDPRLAIYVDDIGITASRVEKSKMEEISHKIEKLFQNSDKNQSLPLNETKKRITSHEEVPEHLGIRMHRNKLFIGNKTRGEINRIKSKLSRDMSTADRKHLKSRKQSLQRYKGYVENDMDDNQN